MGRPGGAGVGRRLAGRSRRDRLPCAEAALSHDRVSGSWGSLLPRAPEASSPRGAGQPAELQVVLTGRRRSDEAARVSTFAASEGAPGCLRCDGGPHGTQRPDVLRKRTCAPEPRPGPHPAPRWGGLL